MTVRHMNLMMLGEEDVELLNRSLEGLQAFLYSKMETGIAAPEQVKMWSRAVEMQKEINTLWELADD